MNEGILVGREVKNTVLFSDIADTVMNIKRSRPLPNPQPSPILLQQLPGSRLGPKTSIPLVKLLDVRGHRAPNPFDLALTREEAASETKLDLAAHLIDGSANGEEAV